VAESGGERGSDPLADLADHRLRAEPPAPQSAEDDSHPEGERHEEERAQQDQVEFVDRNDRPEEVEREGGEVEPCRASPADPEEREDENRRPPRRATIRRRFFHMNECNPEAGRGRTRYGFFPYSRTEST